MTLPSAGPVMLVLALTTPIYAASAPQTTPPPSAATAQPSAETAQPSETPDDEEVFDEKLREFGYWSGAAYNCVADTKQAEVERQVIQTYDGIAKLFGTDRAFFYAAAFGRGTAHQVDKARCPEFLEKFQKATALRGRR